MIEIQKQQKIKTPDDIDSNKYYGVIGNKGLKGFVVQCPSDRVFSVMCVNHFTRSNYLIFTETTSLIDLITDVVDSGFKCFEFDTANELFGWLVD